MKKYKAYKNLKFNLLKEIPIDWTLLKIKFIANIYTGDSLNDDYKTLFESEEPNHLAYISSKDIDVDTSEVQYENGLRIPSDFGKFKIAKRNNSLLCIEGGSAGRKMAFINQDVFFVNKLACFATEDPINSKFIFYCLRSDVFQTQFFNSIAGLIGGVSISNLKNFYFPFPLYNDKVRIVRFLDHQTSLIDELIQRKEKQIELLKEKRQSIINEVVTKGLSPNSEMKDSGVVSFGMIPLNCTVSKLKYLSNVKGRIGFRGYTTDDLVEEGNGALALGATHITWEGNIDLSNPVYISWPKYEESPEIKLEIGNIIIVQRGSTCGKVAIISSDIGPATINPSLVVLKELKANPYYVFASVKAALEELVNLTRSAAIPMLSQEQIGNLQIVLPPIEIQNEVEIYLKEKISKFDILIDKCMESISKLKEYRQSLISEAVTGKIDVRDWISESISH